MEEKGGSKLGGDETNMTYEYKIRNSETGLYKRAGGHWVEPQRWRWSKRGKTWVTLGALKNHLRLCFPYKYEFNPGLDLIAEYKNRYPTHQIVKFQVDRQEAE